MGDSQRWWIIDLRYLSISVTYQESDIEQPNHISAWIFDVSIRPLCTLHIASTWQSLCKCENFTFLCTTFQTLNYASDIYETDETCVYPLSNAPSGGDFLAFLWKAFALGICRQCSLWRELLMSLCQQLKAITRSFIEG